ncbi:ABC transporter substrate-binding protein [Gammaproteobacteria bacterium AS21]|jgi:iron complex transport system substrate-binding protein
MSTKKMHFSRAARLIASKVGAKAILSCSIVLMSINAFAVDTHKIVSADGSLTEIVYALGQQHLLVGVDTTSGYPAVAKSLAQIGYKRNISAEGVLSLAPTVLIATEDSGPDKIISQIEQAGIVVKRYSAKPGLNAVKEKILGVANLLGVADKGRQLWADVDRQVQQAQTQLKSIETPIKVMFVLSNGQGSPLVSGSDTMADAIIKLAGANNAVQGFSGYKPMPVESIISAAPEVILMMDRGGDHGADSAILSSPGFELTPAAINQRLVKMDGMLMLGFGPRIGIAIGQLSQAFYPEFEGENP